MPVTSLLQLRRLSRGVPTEYAPGETDAPILGSATRPPPIARLVSAPFVMDEYTPTKYSSIQYRSFVDEMCKIAYVPNTPGDQAGVLRALLRALLGKAQFTPSDEPSTAQVAEQRLLYGGELGRESYTEMVQQRLTERLLNETRLRAALEARERPVSRIIG